MSVPDIVTELLKVTLSRETSNGSPATAVMAFVTLLALTVTIWETEGNPSWTLKNWSAEGTTVMIGEAEVVVTVISSKMKANKLVQL